MDQPADVEGTIEESGSYCEETPPIAWVGFNHDTFPVDSWQYLKDGTIVSIENTDPVDLMSVDTYDDFDLEFQWRISLGGNSGVLYRVSEDVQLSWHSGPEMQIVDDWGHPDGRIPETSTGAVYGLIAPSKRKILRPTGTFNSARIVCRGNAIEHWLNGQKIVEYDPESPQFKELVAKSRFSNHRGFAMTKRGHIVLQHHGNAAWFRHIRIALPGSKRSS